MSQPNITTITSDADAINDLIADATIDRDQAITDKLQDAMTPGYWVDFDPEEAEQVGAFREDAISEQSAVESAVDLIDSAAVIPDLES